MNENVRNFIIGLVTIIALIGLGGLLMMLGELDALTTRRYPVELRMNIAAGLRAGSSVELNGVPVGSVSEIAIDHSDPTYPVRVTLRIDWEQRIPKEFDARVDAALIGGASVLQLVSHPPPPGERVEFLDRERMETRHTFQKTLFEQISDEIDTRMAGLTASLENFDRLTETYIELGENLTDLVRRQEPDELTDGEPPNLRAAVAKLNSLLERADGAVGRAEEWLADERLRESLHETLTGARRMIDTAAETFEQITSSAIRLEADASELAQRLLPVADELAATLEEVRRLTQLASQGRGTIAQLLNNPDLYNALTDAAIRLERALVEAQLLMQKIQAEGIPFRF